MCSIPIVFFENLIPTLVQMKILETGRKKIIQLFEFLKALNDLRNPVIKHIEDQPWLLSLTNFQSIRLLV